MAVDGYHEGADDVVGGLGAARDLVGSTFVSVLIVRKYCPDPRPEFGYAHCSTSTSRSNGDGSGYVALKNSFIRAA
jgi:hypothetical protein